MSRPRREDEDRRSSRADSNIFKERLYGELTTPESQEEKYAELEKKKKKGGFFGHKNFYFWLYEFTKKHFAKKSEEKYSIPEAVEGIDTGETGRRGKKKKKKQKREISKDYREAFDFLGWKLEPEVVMNIQMGAAAIGLILGLLLAGGAFMAYVISGTSFSTGSCGDGICYDMPWQNPVEDEISCPKDCVGDVVTRQSNMPSSGPPIIIYALIALIPVLSLATMVYYAQRYPLKAAETEKMRALTYVPEIMNYLIMKMRIQPNLENAVEFASEHGEGRIAEEFKELLWKNRVGIYNTIEEGLDEMAYRWEPYSEEFKHAITLLRASVLVPNDVERSALYDKLIESLLESTKEKMENYARSMKQPSMYLFYVAILLPLMILIMLPVAAVFAKMPIATVGILSLLYIILFPSVTFFYARTILSKRPGGYVPPDIPDNHLELPKKGTARIAGMKIPIAPVAILLLIMIIVLGYFIEQVSQPTDEQMKLYKVTHGKDLKHPSFIQYYLPLAIAVSLGLYLYGNAIEKKRIQDKVIRMEDDFQDAMYLMASHLGEKKPLEDCLSYVKKFMSGSPLATDVFEKIQRNIMVLGLTLKTSLFDPSYGVLRNIPSRLMRSSFKIMVDSVDLGPEVASYSLMSVSEQIGDTQRIKKLMRTLLDEVTSMMSSMAMLIGPVVLGMVASLQQVIVSIAPGASISSTGNEGADTAISGASSALGGNLLGSGSADINQLMASSLEFQLIIAIYVILLAVILSYFTGKVKFGDDKNSIKLTMGKTIPIAIAIFCGALYAGQMLMAGIS